MSTLVAIIVALIVLVLVLALGKTLLAVLAYNSKQDEIDEELAFEIERHAMDEETLEACWICRQDKNIILRKTKDQTYFYYCMGCGRSSTPMKTTELARKKWNHSNNAKPNDNTGTNAKTN